MPRRRLALCRVRCFAKHVVRLTLFMRACCPGVVRQNGDTALIQAADEGHTDIVQLLLEHGADVNLVDRVSGACVGRAVGVSSRDMLNINEEKIDNKD